MCPGSTHVHPRKSSGGRGWGVGGLREERVSDMGTGVKGRGSRVYESWALESRSWVAGFGFRVSGSG